MIPLGFAEEGFFFFLPYFLMKRYPMIARILMQGFAALCANVSPMYIAKKQIIADLSFRLGNQEKTRSVLPAYCPTLHMNVKPKMF